nr:ribosomal protein L32 [Clematis rutoides]UTD48170.1 ribosomal protein L32 [Clematis rutoides]
MAVQKKRISMSKKHIHNFIF